MGLVLTEKHHLKKVKCKIKNIEGDATVFYEGYSFYLIQNIKEGSEPDNYGWQDYGNYSWRFIPTNLSLDGVEILKIYSKESNYELWD